MEYLDIVNENDELTGETKDRDYVYNNNLYHRCASCWVLNHKGEILLQRRALTKKEKPGIWSKTGGHVSAGETVIDAIKREIKEEIGLSLEDEDLFFMKKFKCTNPNFFLYNYIALTDKNIEDYKLQLEELDKIEYYKIEDLENEIKSENKLFDFYYWETEEFLEQIKELKKFKDEKLQKMV